MDRVRDVCSAGLALREAHRLRTRLPLPGLTIAGEDVDHLPAYAELIRDELNVKAVAIAHRMEDFGTFQFVPNAPLLGPKLGPDMKKVMAAARAGDWKVDGERALVGGVVLEAGEFQLRLVPKEGVVSAALSTNDAVVVLDTAVTPELEREGLARDLVRMVQQARKDAGLHVSDRIRLAVATGAAGQGAVEAHREYIAAQVLAVEITLGEGQAEAFAADGKLGGEATTVRVAKA
jgi:isoleucyl-tRNA synthetase